MAHNGNRYHGTVEEARQSVMAEGHSTVRWARELRRLQGQRLERVNAPARSAERAGALAGERVLCIDTHGKHLLIRLSDGHTIHCHAMMYGSWQFGRPGMKLRKPHKQVRLRLLTAEAEAVFFNGPVVEVLTEGEARRHPRLRALGPDVMKEDFDREAAWRRIHSQGSREIGDAILDQTLVAGVGNIFKAEGLFLAGMDPACSVERISRDELDRLWDVLIPQMLEAASRPGPILTLPRHLRRGRDRNWVYWRSGRPCFRCEARISTLRQGEMRRITFFCPRCQKSELTDAS